MTLQLTLRSNFSFDLEYCISDVSLTYYDVANLPSNRNEGFNYMTFTSITRLDKSLINQNKNMTLPLTLRSNFSFVLEYCISDVSLTYYDVANLPSNRNESIQLSDIH